MAGWKDRHRRPLRGRRRRQRHGREPAPNRSALQNTLAGYRTFRVYFGERHKRHRERMAAFDAQRLAWKLGQGALERQQREDERYWRDVRERDERWERERRRLRVRARRALRRLHETAIEAAIYGVGAVVICVVGWAVGCGAIEGVKGIVELAS